MLLNDLIVECKNLLENWLRENKSINENFNIMPYEILNSSMDKLLELVEDSIFFMKLLKIWLKKIDLLKNIVMIIHNYIYCVRE